MALSVLLQNIPRENELINMISGMLNLCESYMEVESPVLCVAVQEYGHVACFSAPFLHKVTKKK